MKTTLFLVIDANRDARVVKRRPQLALNEIAYRLNIDFPDSWSKIVGDINLTAPEFVPEVEVVEP